jgi:hypothetical protein
MKYSAKFVYEKVLGFVQNTHKKNVEFLESFFMNGADEHNKREDERFLVSSDIPQDNKNVSFDFKQQREVLPSPNYPTFMTSKGNESKHHMVAKSVLEYVCELLLSFYIHNRLVVDTTYPVDTYHLKIKSSVLKEELDIDTKQLSRALLFLTKSKYIYRGDSERVHNKSLATFWLSLYVPVSFIEERAKQMRSEELSENQHDT